MQQIPWEALPAGPVAVTGAPPSGEEAESGTAPPQETVVPLPLEAEAETMPPAPEDAFLPYVRPPPAPSGRRPASRPSVPPPRVVRSLDAAPPHPSPAPLAAAPIQARPVLPPPPATVQKEEVRTIDLEAAAGKVMELPRARPALALGKTEAPSRPARQETPKEQAAAGAPAAPAAEPEVDPTLPFNPWGTRKK